MFGIVRDRTLLKLTRNWPWSHKLERDLAVFATPEALEQPCTASREYPHSEAALEYRVGSHERERLCNELTALCNKTPTVSVTVGTEHYEYGEKCTQAMPFEYRRPVAYYYSAFPETVKLASHTATSQQISWERRPINERCAIIEKAAKLIAGQSRQRIAAAAMLGQGMTAMQAEFNICQLVDYLRYGCVFMRELAMSHCVVDGGEEAHNRNQYHGLEGFWAAITPSDSFAFASQLAITPLITGNGVVWKPSDHAVLACYRVFECLQSAGLPAGVINFVPAQKKTFLNSAVSNKDLAGISFAGTTATLEHVWQAVGKRIKQYACFPRLVGTGSGNNFHVVHSSASLPGAVSCTVRAAFEMAGQKSLSCSRVFVALSVLNRFMDLLQTVAKSLVVCHPLDYRCFTSSLISKEAYDEVVGLMKRAARDGSVRLIAGGRYDDSVGYYVEPTVYLVQDSSHELMCGAVRGPLLTVCPYLDGEEHRLERAVTQAPYAITGSIFAQDPEWARWAIGALRVASTSLCLNGRCSELRPAQQSAGGARKSGSGAKAGSLSYLLHFCTERSLREELRPRSAVTYPYMDEVRADRVDGAELHSDRCK